MKKKFLLGLLVVIGVFSVTGCGCTNKKITNEMVEDTFPLEYKTYYRMTKEVYYTGKTIKYEDDSHIERLYFKSTDRGTYTIDDKKDGETSKTQYEIVYASKSFKVDNITYTYEIKNGTLILDDGTEKKKYFEKEKR